MEKEKRDHEEQKRTEAEREMQMREESKQKSAQPPVNVSPMKPVTHGAYGGGMYGTEAVDESPAKKPPASESQSADGPDEFSRKNPKQVAPPSSGDRDIDITGQSYFQ